jgi:hypothetical protein
MIANAMNMVISVSCGEGSRAGGGFYRDALDQRAALAVVHEDTHGTTAFRPRLSRKPPDVASTPEQPSPRFRIRRVRDSKRKLLDFAMLRFEWADGVHCDPLAGANIDSSFW